MLLCSAFKNFVGDQRAAWRMVNALRKRAEDRKTYGAATAQEVEFAVVNKQRNQACSLLWRLLLLLLLQVDELADYEQSVQAEIMTTCTALMSMLDKLLEAGNLDVRECQHTATSPLRAHTDTSCLCCSLRLAWYSSKCRATLIATWLKSTHVALWSSLPQARLLMPSASSKATIHVVGNCHYRLGS